MSSPAGRRPKGPEGRGWRPALVFPERHGASRLRPRPSPAARPLTTAGPLGGAGVAGKARQPRRCWTPGIGDNGGASRAYE